MNQIERIRDDLLGRFPGLDAEIDPPADTKGGTWHLDVRREGASPVVVEWRPDRGFGVSTAEDDDPAYGIGPDEVYPNAGAALERVAELIVSGGRSGPSAAARLADAGEDARG